MASSMLANSRLLFYASRRLPRSTPELQFVRVRQQQPQQQPQQQQQQRRLAGHSKWANIRHKKGKEDKARAAIHGKASRAIYGAAKECGGDLSNLRLQSCIGRAKSVQLPKNRIEEVRIMQDMELSVSIFNRFSNLQYVLCFSTRPLPRQRPNRLRNKIWSICDLMQS
jgi:hypothetical protein